MKEIFEQIDKWLQEAKDELSESIYAHEGGFHRGEVAAYTRVGVLLQRHLTSHSSRAAGACACNISAYYSSKGKCLYCGGIKSAASLTKR